MALNGYGPGGDPAVAELVTQAERAFVRGESERGSELIGNAAQILVRKGQVDAAIALCENARDFGRAAYIAEQVPDLRRAAQLWMRAGDYQNSARVRLLAGEPMMAADLYEKASSFLDAARIYEQHQDLVRAALLYERANDKKRAADLLVRALRGEANRRLFGAEATEMCRRAAVMYAELGQIDLAVRVLTWGGQNTFAGQLLARVGRLDEAIAMLTATGDYLAAAEVAREGGDERRAQELLATRAEMEGRLQDAAAHYEEAGQFVRAARLHEYTQDPRRAARAYELGGQFDAAAQHYEQLGEIQLAARCLRAAGREAEAQALSRRATGAEGLIKAHLDKGDFVNASIAALSLARAGEPARYAEAVAFLELVDPSHPDYIAARTVTAQIHAEQGDNRSALRVLQKLFGGVVPGRQHLEALYQYGRVLELEGYLAGARGAYQTAAMFDPNHRDVSARLMHLRESASGMQAIPALASNGVPTVPMVVGGPMPRSVSTIGSIPFPKIDSTPGSTSQPALPAVDDLSIETPSSPGHHPTFDEEDEPSINTMDLIDQQLKDLSTGDLPPPPDFDKPFPAEAAGTSDLDGVVLRGRFRIEKLIGKGAQAHVYLARDQVLDREVAIKILNEAIAQDPDALERFLREARLAARVHHAGCISIYDFGEERGLTFMAMEYFKGRTLKDLVRKKALNTYLALRVVRDVAAALGAVHEAGIIHRDVKPTNIMVDRAGRVRLTDFGVASNLGDEKNQGMMVGTMRYMAPEQARGKDVDARSDIFSMGVVLYEMVAGEAPFGGTLDDLIKRVQKAPPPLPPEVDAPRIVHDIVKRCMERKPSHRYATVRELIEDIDDALKHYKKKPKTRG